MWRAERDLLAEVMKISISGKTFFRGVEKEMNIILLFKTWSKYLQQLRHSTISDEPMPLRFRETPLRLSLISLTDADEQRDAL